MAQAFFDLVSHLPAIRSAISHLPDLFVSAVIPEEEEPGSDERNEADDLEIYRCPVFMNRVSCGLVLIQRFNSKHHERMW